MIQFLGTIHGRRIDVDEPLPYTDGTRVVVSVSPAESLRKGSPEAILTLVGTLSEDEADAILRTVESCRQVDASLWTRSVA